MKSPGRAVGESPSPNPSAPPIFANEAVANPAQTARPGRKYNLYSAPSQNPLQEKGSVGAGLPEWIRPGREGVS